MGSKSSSAPAPDPRLVEGQLRSMGIQDSAIQKIMANSDSLMPMQRQQLQFGLDTSRKAFDQSQEDRTWALGKRDQLDAAQKPLLDAATNFNEHDRGEQMRGEAFGDIGQAFSAARGEGARGLARMGVNPSDGRFAAMESRTGVDEALAKANAGMKVRAAAKAEGLNLQTNAANMLSGFPAMASGLTGQGQGFGSAGVGLTGQSLNGMNSGYDAAGRMGGNMGANATGMWNAQAGYKNGQDQIAAANNPMSTILGAGTGIATKWALGQV
jgi:hypothetical protein